MAFMEPMLKILLYACKDISGAFFFTKMKLTRLQSEGYHSALRASL